MKAEDVGKYFTTTGEDIWELVLYCEYPTATMENIKTGDKVVGAVNSPALKRFIRFVPEETLS